MPNNIHHVDNIKQLEHIINHWQSSILDFLPQLFLAVTVFILFFLLAKFARHYCLNFYKKTIKRHIDIAHILASVIYFFFIVSGTMLSLQIIGLEQVLTKLLAGAGVVGIIAGFAFKDVASNIFAGLLLKFQQPFKTNDWVEIDDAYGVICEVGWITTVIRTVPGQQVFIPNQVIYNSTFTNYSAFKKRRVILETGVSYGDDLDLVKSSALDEIKKIDGVLKDELIDLYFTEIGSYSYNFHLRCWIEFRTNDDYLKVMSDIIMHIKRRFEKENISLAYAVTTLDFGVKGGVNIFDKPLQIHQENIASLADTKN